MIFKISQKKGFSLVELLFVISIIGLMSSIILSSLDNTKRKSRDARRLEDVRQIQAALQLYYNDNGFYPGSLLPPPPNAPAYDSCISDDPNFDNISTIWGNNNIYLPNVPVPPPSTNSVVSVQCYFYVLTNNKQGYYILMSPEDQSTNGIKSKDDSRCPQSAGNYFSVCVNTNTASDN